MTISTYQFIIFLFGEVIFYAAFNLYLYGICNGRVFRRNTTDTTIIILVIFADIIIYYAGVIPIIRMISAVMNYTIIGYIYSHNIRKGMLYSFLFTLIHGFCELFSAFALATVLSVSVSQISSNELTYSVGLFLSRFLLLLTAYLIYMRRTQLNISHKTTHFWPIITIFLSGSMFVFYILASLCLNNKITDYPPVIFTICILIVFDSTVFYLYDRQCKDYELRELNNKLHLYIEMQKAEQENTITYMRKISSIKHDMKNIFIGLNGLIESGEYDKAMAVVKENTLSLSITNPVINTPDNVINSLINYKIACMQNQGITLEHYILLDVPINVNYNDLCVILGNAVDNAMDYITSHPTVEKVITLKIRFTQGMLNIHISNPVADNIVIPSDNRIPSTKTEQGHGYGLLNIENTIAKYNGLMKLSCSNNIFNINIKMIIEEAHND